MASLHAPASHSDLAANLLGYGRNPLMRHAIDHVQVWS